MSYGEKICWGVLATGHIANKFVSSARATGEAEIVAAASRTSGKAEAFCRKWEIPNAYESYADLLQDERVEAVYVANTHNFHFETVLMALEAGKPVLCEKPLTINSVQSAKLINTAREKGLFLMEAMWTRFLPTVAKIRQWLEAGAIGDVRMVQASFGLCLSDKERLRDPKLAGGALLDLGIYPLSFASMVSGARAPQEVHSMADCLETGVDAASLIQIDYGDGLRADLQCASTMVMPNEVWIVGTEGKIHVPEIFIFAREAQLIRGEEREVESFSDPDEITFRYEIEEAHRCLREGLGESPTMPLHETLLLAETMDSLRKDWGVRYPGE